MRFAFGILTVLACGMLVPVAPLGAQDRDSRPNRPWVVEISRGIPSGYAGTGVEQAMRRAGLDETAPYSCFLFCGGPFPHPKTYQGGEGRQIAVARRLPPRFEVRVRYMTASLGRTTGYRDGRYLSLYTSASTLALTGGLDAAGGALWLSAGPAFSRVSVSRWSQGSGAVTNRIALGVVLEGKLRVPARKRFFVSLSARRLQTASITAGPVTVTGFWGATVARLARFRANASHWMVGFGFGVNL